MTNKYTISITSLNGCRIRVQRINNQEYLCLTDLAKYTQKPHDIQQQWIRSKKTHQFLTEWETLHNPGFKKMEFEPKTLSVIKWIQLTGATGLITKRGRYDSGTWAHIDIATEFMSAISVAFRLYTIQELHRLRSQEARLANPSEEWLTCRALARSNYQQQTYAIQTYLTKGDSVLNPHYVYATEADLINKIIFGMTAKQFRELNPNLEKNKNLRDFAEKNQVLLVSNLETLNSMFIAQGKSRSERFELLTAEKNRQLQALNKTKKLKKS